MGRRRWFGSDPTSRRPGKVLYYFLHQYTTDGNLRQHLFAAVYWYSVAPCTGNLLKIWNDEHISEGPAMFLPINQLECRCVVANGTVPLPSGTEERVLFISPLPGFKFQ